MGTTATHTAMGYRATREGDTLTVHRVPIFVECERGEHNFDAVWIAQAVATAHQDERESYLPPLHVRHHEPSTDATNSVRAAGVFRILGAEPITFKGSRRTAILADLIITNPEIAAEVEAMRLPYRSVEIFNVDRPKIDSLALLDHEAPFLELPMLMVADVEEITRAGDSPMVACFRRGAGARLLFREENPMETKTKAAEAEPFGAGVVDETKTALFADDAKKDDDAKGEDMEADGGLDVAAVCKAIESGEISVSDMDAILAAIQAQKTETAPEEEDVAGGAPAAAPGYEAMKNEPDTDLAAQFAALRGENEGLKARLDERDAAEQRTRDVAEAVTRLDGRPLGADLEERLMSFHAEHGGAAFAAYVDGLAKSVGVLPRDDSRGAAFASQLGSVPEVAMKYQDRGTDAVDKAARIAREWEEQQGAGLRVPLERYVELNMN